MPLRVLVVNDEEKYLRPLVTSITKQGHLVKTASSIPAARSLHEDMRPDAAVLDWQIDPPKMDFSGVKWPFGVLQRYVMRGRTPVEAHQFMSEPPFELSHDLRMTLMRLSDQVRITYEDGLHLAKEFLEKDGATHVIMATGDPALAENHRFQNLRTAYGDRIVFVNTSTSRLGVARRLAEIEKSRG